MTSRTLGSSHAGNVQQFNNTTPSKGTLRVVADNEKCVWTHTTHDDFMVVRAQQLAPRLLLRKDWNVHWLTLILFRRMGLGFQVNKGFVQTLQIKFQVKILTVNNGLFVFYLACAIVGRRSKALVYHYMGQWHCYHSNSAAIQTYVALRYLSYNGFMHRRWSQQTAIEISRWKVAMHSDSIQCHYSS